MRHGGVELAGSRDGLGARPERRYVAAVDRGLRRWARQAAVDASEPEAALTFFRQELERTRARTAELGQALTRFESAHARAESRAEKRRVILDFAAALGAGRAARGRDRIALRRWFDFEAVAERCHNRLGEAEKHAATLAERAGAVAGNALGNTEADARVAVWHRLDPERVLEAVLYYDGDARVSRAALAALLGALRQIPVDRREHLLSHKAARLVHQTAQDPRRDAWSQCEALALLATISDSGFTLVARRRLDTPAGDPDLFVRARLVGYLGQRFAERGEDEVVDLVKDAARDPSAHVRQRVCYEISRFDVVRGLAIGRDLLTADAAPQVRAAAAIALGQWAARDGEREIAAALADAIPHETDTFVLRVLVDTLAVERGHENGCDTRAHAWSDLALAALDDLHVGASATVVRREAAMAAERLRVSRDPDLHSLMEALRARASGLAPGRRRRLPRRLLRDRGETEIGRVLAVLAQDDVGYEVGRGLFGPWIRRGERAGFRLWRFLHEMRRPSPDKRQGSGHTRGRVYLGHLVAPSAILAEVSPTKVPGEPLQIEEEQGWRPYLPLPDHVVSAVDSGRRLRLFTAEGVTTLEPPRSLVSALRAKLQLSWYFQRFADARNWTHVAAVPVGRYAEMLRSARVDMHLDGYAGAPPEPRAARFFAAGPLGLGLGLPALDRALIERFQTYFLSVYQNSLRDLLLFLAGAGGLFLVRRVQLFRRILRSRRRLPLVIGGWGTRGKSGTERLKAGLMNALGYSVFSKTSGCEAMFLFAPAHRPLRELFLFRPYDKATIWEQAAVTQLADRLGSDVFLWECMGLTPSYARILQSQWMRDDLSTITNTYPDHEDLQGPAGRDIPHAMAEFIPKRSRLITSEEQMRPVLRDACRATQTSFAGIGWREAGLIPDDVLARFPYDEHPFNIALVVRVAEELGVSPDFACKEMADRVVPDLGVLKTFPTAPVQGRHLQFVNGMSANERYGALNNWTRMGFDRQDPTREPGVVVSTVINNRADRVARSRVFAAMLVDDLSADRHVLIGSNLEGLTGYIEDALGRRLAGLTLWPQDSAEEQRPADILAAAAHWLRQTRDDDEVFAQFAMCLPADVDPHIFAASLDDPDKLRAALIHAEIEHAEEIAGHVHRWREQRDAYRALRGRIDQADEPKAILDEAYRTWWAEVFRAKLVVVHDTHATGDEIVAHLTAVTPPHHLNRVMGMQNIKGVGLDFIYRWQAWESVHTACAQLESHEPNASSEGLRRLLAFREHGVLTYETVRTTLNRAFNRLDMQTDSRQSSLSAIGEAAEAAHPDRDGGTANMDGLPGAIRRVVEVVESFLDAGDAVRRRRRAERVYRDMVAERIGYDRATRAVLDLTKRQQGGWLSRALLRRWRRLIGRTDHTDSADAVPNTRAQ